MTKHKHKKQSSTSLEYLTELRCRVLIESTGSSLRLSGSKVTNEQVGQILNATTNKSSERK